MIVLTITPRKKRIRDFFIKREPQRQFFNYEFPKEAKATNGQLIGMHEAYRIARNSGYIKDQAVSYATMTAIVAEAYKQGYEKAEADKKPHS